MTKPSFPTRLTLLLASSLTVMASVTIAPALPEISDYFAEQENAAFWARLLLTTPALSIALAAIPAGLLIDALGRQKPMIVASIIYAASGSAGLWLDSLGGLMISRIILGLSVAVLMTATTTLIGDWFVGSAREKFLGFQGASMGFGGVVFLTAAGLLVEFSWRGPFAIYLLSLAVPLLALFTLRRSKTPRDVLEADHSHDDEAPPRPDPVPNLVIYGLACLVFLTFYQVPTQIPFILERQGLTDGLLTGVVVATMPLFGASLAVFYRAGKERFSFPGVMTVCFSLMAAGFAIVALSPTWPTTWIGTAVAGVGLGWTMPNLNVWLLAGAAPARRGRAVGLLTSGVFIGQFTAPLVAQPLVSAAGTRAPFWAAAAILVLVAIILGRAPRRSAEAPNTA